MQQESHHIQTYPVVVQSTRRWSVLCATQAGQARGVKLLVDAPFEIYGERDVLHQLRTAGRLVPSAGAIATAGEAVNLAHITEYVGKHCGTAQAQEHVGCMVAPGVRMGSMRMTLPLPCVEARPSAAAPAPLVPATMPASTK